MSQTHTLPSREKVPCPQGPIAATMLDYRSDFLLALFAISFTFCAGEKAKKQADFVLRSRMELRIQTKLELKWVRRNNASPCLITINGSLEKNAKWMLVIRIYSVIVEYTTTAPRET